MAELDHIIEDIWKRFDLDSNGTISLQESVAFYGELIKNRPDLGLTDAHHETWFKGIDADGDGTISREELKGYLAGVSYTDHHH